MKLSGVLPPLIGQGPKLSCPKCGSQNVKIRPAFFGHSVVGDIMEWLNKVPYGDKLVICKDCGQESFVRGMMIFN